MTDHDLPDISFLTSGEVSDADRDAARAAVRSALDGGADDVTSVRVTLSVVPDADLPCPALAQAIVGVDGARLRAQAAGRTLPEAIDLLRDRLHVRTAYLRAG
ncbi:HPF/RaiA family ribosome-associated protein [Actinomadura atramentaria]|uniref:HPF/RaiA family ribosome-associated protein n=1 Tax=Actinomadura atramentaria TaxID=1990 RepID=UPI00036E05F5|nr:HPF/RaiA family ribosome-associated protein [Actinomadura atramentaria]